VKVWWGAGCEGMSWRVWRCDEVQGVKVWAGGGEGVMRCRVWRYDKLEVVAAWWAGEWACFLAYTSSRFTFTQHCYCCFFLWSGIGIKMEHCVLIWWLFSLQWIHAPMNGGLQVCYFGILHYITIEIHINPVIVTVIDYAVTFFFLCACVMLL